MLNVFQLFPSLFCFQKLFEGEAIKRITEPVEIMLPDKLLSSLSASGERLSGEAAATDELPTMHDLRRYVQLIVTEVERVEACPELLLKDIIRSVRSSVLFFATRLEQVVGLIQWDPVPLQWKWDRTTATLFASPNATSWTCPKRSAIRQ